MKAEMTEKLLDVHSPASMRVTPGGLRPDGRRERAMGRMGSLSSYRLEVLQTIDCKCSHTESSPQDSSRKLAGKLICTNSFTYLPVSSHASDVHSSFPIPASISITQNITINATFSSCVRSVDSSTSAERMALLICPKYRFHSLHRYL